ncbi:MAG: hypothetical protein AB7V32_03460, partial [Candidatus Berkiella sp.]
MPFTFDPTFDDTRLQNQHLTQEIEALKRFITPDHELLDGHDMLGYRLEREKDSVDEITQMIKEETYVDPSLSPQENLEKKEELLAQIKEHQADIKKLQKQRIEIPKAIARFEKIQQAKKNDVAVFKISKDTTREEIKTLLKAIETRLQTVRLRDEKRVLTYLQLHLDMAKTMIDTGKALEDDYLYLHQRELKYLGNIEPLKPVQTRVAVNMMENILQHLVSEQDRLRQKGSPLHEAFTRPIQKITQRLNDVVHDPDTIHHQGKMRETVMVVARLANTLEREKEVSPSFKDRLRNMVNGFRAFMDNVFGIKISEVESLKSKTLTNMYDTQRETRRLARLAPRHEPDNVRPD